MKSKIIDRLKEFIEYKGISLNAFDKAIGASNGYIGRQIKNRASVGGDVIEKISCVYTDLYLEWLITGRGEMLKGKEIKSDTKDKGLSNSELLDRIERLSAEKAVLENRVEVLEAEKKIKKSVSSCIAAEREPELSKKHK